MGRLGKYKKLTDKVERPRNGHERIISKIRDVCGTNAQSNSSIDTIDEQKRSETKANHSDIYLAQLKNFIAHNSHSTFKSLQISQSHNNNNNNNKNLVSVNQAKDLGRKCKRFVYRFMKGLFDERTSTIFKNGKILKEEPIYFEFNDIKIDTKRGNKIKKTKTKTGQHIKNNNKFNGMQNISIRVEQATSAKAQDNQHDSLNQQRPPHLFSKANTTCEIINIQNIPSRSASSEEDNSPTELNNCRRLIDKPPLVKRLAMGLLRTSEESRPLVLNTPSPTSSSMHTISDGYVNEGICDPDKIISSKFGDSCRKSLTSVLDKSYKDSCEFDLKKHFLRETNSANSSPRIFGPRYKRIEGLSLVEQNELKGAAWFQAGIPREISLEVLSRQSPGAFLVRQSSTKPGCFALSLRVPPPAPKVAHYLILRTSRGYKIKGFTKEFSSLKALITHHSVMPELLPVPLALPRPKHFVPQSRRLDDFDTYGSLTDFRKMMSDLNV